MENEDIEFRVSQADIADKIKAKIEAKIAQDYFHTRVCGIWSRILFAAIVGVDLIIMGLKPIVVGIWLFGVCLSQFVEKLSNDIAFKSPFDIKLRERSYLLALLGSIIYCAIAPFGWFYGDEWAKACITWFVIGSIVSHATATHRVQIMRFRMMLPYIIALPLISMAQVLFENHEERTPAIAISISFVFGSFFLIYLLRKKLIHDAAYEEMRIEQEFSRTQAIEANRAKSEFVASISHDLRNPLNAILGSAFLMRQNIKSNDDAQLLETLLQSGQNMVSLLDEVLDHAKMESGKLSIENKTFCPQILLDDIADLWERPIGIKDLEFICDYHGELPLALVGDEKRIRQIVNNILSNAIKFTKIGWICLKANYKNNRLRIEVHDSGIGINKNELGQLFEPFTQANSEISFIYGGTGLGLSNCANLAKLMGGEIWVESKSGKGSAFYVDLPLALGDEKNLEIKKHSNFEISKLKGIEINILAADDNGANRLVLGRFLTEIGAEFEMVEDGFLAVQYADEKEYDLILLDVRMPNIDGLEACKKIRKSSRFNRDTPIIMLSADAGINQIKRGLDAGADGYLTKPIEAARLYTLIANARNGRDAFLTMA